MGNILVFFLIFFPFINYDISLEPKEGSSQATLRISNWSNFDISKIIKQFNNAWWNWMLITTLYFTNEKPTNLASSPPVRTNVQLRHGYCLMWASGENISIELQICPQPGAFCWLIIYKKRRNKPFLSKQKLYNFYLSSIYTSRGCLVCWRGPELSYIFWTRVTSYIY